MADQIGPAVFQFRLCPGVGKNSNFENKIGRFFEFFEQSDGVSAFGVDDRGRERFPADGDPFPRRRGKGEHEKAAAIMGMKKRGMVFMKPPNSGFSECCFWYDDERGDVKAPVTGGRISWDGNKGAAGFS